MGLVAYDSDSSSNHDTDEPANAASKSSAQVFHASQAASSVKPAQKRKALPGLPETYTSRYPRDDPALHHGRKRTRPFVDGDYDAHVYIALTVPKRVHQALDRIIQRARDLCPDLTLVSLLDPPDLASDSPRDLHISLTHPFPLRRSQIDSFAADLTQRLVKSNGPFQLSFAGGLKMYYNGAKTGGQGMGGRAFLAFQAGAGHGQIDALVARTIHPLLQKLHVPLYHSNPEYHASFAWCLLPGDSLSIEDGVLDAGAAHSVPFSHTMIRQLDEELREVFLISQPDGGWKVNELKLKVGKETRTLSL